MPNRYRVAVLEVFPLVLAGAHDDAGDLVPQHRGRCRRYGTVLHLQVRVADAARGPPGAARRRRQRRASGTPRSRGPGRCPATLLPSYAHLAIRSRLPPAFYRSPRRASHLRWTCPIVPNPAPSFLRRQEPRSPSPSFPRRRESSVTAGHTGKQGRGVGMPCHGCAWHLSGRTRPRCQVEPTLVQSPRRREPHNLIVPSAPKCAIVSHSTPAAPPRAREGRPQTPCRHRPAYAVDPRGRKGRMSVILQGWTAGTGWGTTLTRHSNGGWSPGWPNRSRSGVVWGGLSWLSEAGG